MEFVPEKLFHDATNVFSLYGFEYQTIAHYLVIQTHARRGVPFKHFFHMHAKDLPPITMINIKVLEEGLQAMLPQMKPENFKYPVSHQLLGIGATRFRLKYGAPQTGKNLYGRCMTAVLNRRILV